MHAYCLSGSVTNKQSIKQTNKTGMHAYCVDGSVTNKQSNKQTNKQTKLVCTLTVLQAP